MNKYFNILCSILLGSFIGAVAFKCVLMPNSLTSGGLGGIALIINKLTNINLQLVLGLLCLPIAIWSYVMYGINRIIFALICFIMFTLQLGLVQYVIPEFKTDSILASLLCGVLFGISGGVILRLGIPNGPESLIGLYVKDKFNVPVGTFFTILNIIIISISLIYSDLQTVLYSFIAVYVSGIVNNRIVVGFKKYYEVNIVSDKYIEITEYIHKRLNRGVTYVQCLGTYDLKKRMLIKSLVSNSEVAQLKINIKDIDKDCFVYINESNEVMGRGFTN